MNILGTCLKKFPVAAGAGILLVLLPGCKKPVPAIVKPGATASMNKTNAAPAVVANLPNPYLSVFDDSLPPENKGRDPFFPASTRRIPKAAAPPVIASGPAHMDPVFKLQGVMGGPGRRLAVINDNYILAVGENAEIRIGNGKVHIHVVEIGEDYAIITLAGEPGQKRLEMYQKNRSP